MARSVGWRRECNDVVHRRIEEALEVTLYIVHQTGPTGFVVKEEGRAKKLKVSPTRVLIELDASYVYKLRPLVSIPGVSW